MLLTATIAYTTWLWKAIVLLGRARLTPSRFQRRVIIPTFLFSLMAACLLLVANLVVAMPAVYLTALALLLFQSGFAFCLIVFSFLPRINGAPSED